MAQPFYINAPMQKNQAPHKGNYDGDCDYGNYEIMGNNQSVVDYDPHTLRVFDDTSAEMARRPAVVNAVVNWRMGSGALYQQCCRLSVDRVEVEIREVQKMRGIRNKGAYTLTRLRNLS